MAKRGQYRLSAGARTPLYVDVLQGRATQPSGFQTAAALTLLSIRETLVPSHTELYNEGRRSARGARREGAAALLAQFSRSTNQRGRTMTRMRRMQRSFPLVFVLLFAATGIRSSADAIAGHTVQLTARARSSRGSRPAATPTTSSSAGAGTSSRPGSRPRRGPPRVLLPAVLLLRRLRDHPGGHHAGQLDERHRREDPQLVRVGPPVLRLHRRCHRHDHRARPARLRHRARHQPGHFRLAQFPAYDHRAGRSRVRRASRPPSPCTRSRSITRGDGSDYFRIYQFTGDPKYLTSAIHVADALAANARIGRRRDRSGPTG